MRTRYFILFMCLTPILAGLCGCTTLTSYLQDGFKVGPKYETPPAAVAGKRIDSDKVWLDAAVRPRKDTDDLSKWWTVFNDDKLNQLICNAYHQNLTLRQAGERILQARAQLGIAVGEIFPQTQEAFGDYNRVVRSVKTVNTAAIPTRFYGQFDYGFNLAWELDFWGKFRRAIQSSSAGLEASVWDYDDVLVTLLSDVATNYAILRTTEERIKYAQENAEIQRKTLKIAQARFEANVVRELDVDQAKTLVYQTEATIPLLEITARLATDQLCTLLGMPPEDLRAKLGSGPIPVAKADVALGIPADLLRRRPDVRRAERNAAAQSAQIGVADADFYPHISIAGDIGYSSKFFQNLFGPSALAGSIGPQIQWNVLNYGRILNNVRFQDAKFRELVAAYQNTVLTAQQEAEDGLVTFLKAQQSTKKQADSVKYAAKSVDIVNDQYNAGIVDLTRVTQLELILVQQQDTLAQTQGQITLGLIQTFKAMGGGWELQQTNCEPSALFQAPAPTVILDGVVPER